MSGRVSMYKWIASTQLVITQHLSAGCLRYCMAYIIGKLMLVIRIWKQRNFCICPGQTCDFLSLLSLSCLSLHSLDHLHITCFSCLSSSEFRQKNIPNPALASSIWSAQLIHEEAFAATMWVQKTRLLRGLVGNLLVLTIILSFLGFTNYVIYLSVS